MLIGAASTSLFVYRGVLPRGGVTILRVAVTVGVVALALLTWGERILVGAPSLLPLFLTREGQFLLALAVALGLCIGAVVVVDLWPARWSLWLLGAAGAAAVLVHVAAGHAASPSSVWLLNILVQWVHMTAVGVWVGGLFWLLLGFRGREHDARAAAVGVFTRIATGTLVVVLATGLLRARRGGGVRVGALRHALRHHAGREGRARRRPCRPRRPEPLLLGAGAARRSRARRRSRELPANGASASTRAASSPSPSSCWRRRRS